MNKRLLFGLTVIVLLIFSGCSKNTWVIDNNLSGPINANQTAGQSFYSGRDNLSGINLPIRNPLQDADSSGQLPKQVKIDLHLRLQDQSEDLLVVEKYLDLSTPDQKLILNFDFQPLADSANQSYYFYLNSNWKSATYPLQAYWGDGLADSRSGGMRYENGQPADGQLAFDLQYQDSASEVASNIFHNIFKDKPFIIFYFMLLLANLVLIIYYSKSNKKE